MRSSQQLFNTLSQALTAVYDLPEARSIVGLWFEKKYGLSRTDILLDKPIDIPQNFENEILSRLLNHEPIQYILGEADFYGRVFSVNSATLIPRPETEELVQLAIRVAKNYTNGSILDIGTGSGCIAITLAAELPDFEVSAYDISEKALNMAQKNAQKLGINVRFEQKNILENEKNTPYSSLSESLHRTHHNTPFTIIVSNPPYVIQSEAKTMLPNVLAYEPHLALFVEDQDPLLFYKSIAYFCTKHLADNGVCLVEINAQFGPETRQVFINAGFAQVEILQDLSGKDRFVKVQ